jgi:hypothetical protein
MGHIKTQELQRNDEQWTPAASQVKLDENKVIFLSGTKGNIREMTM